jgi:hypothetical protein
MTTTTDATPVQATPVSMPSAIEQALVAGDIAGLTMEQRGLLYRQTCESLGLNPLTQPFGYLVLNGKLRLYALKGATDQLRALHKISIEIVSMRTERDLYTVHVRARDLHGRVDEDVGFAVVGNLKGEALGNAQLKSVSKAKRRVTLSICGLGMLDESEVASIPEARTYTVETAPAPVAGGEPPQRNGHPASHVTAEQLDQLFGLAEAAQEPKDLLGQRLREVMHLGDEVRISKKFLRERMQLSQFEAARDYYDQLLRRQVEEDVPDGSRPPPGDADTPQATPEADQAGTDGPFASSSSAPEAPADAAAREALVREAMEVGLPEGECRHIVTMHRDLAKAREILTSAARKKIQVASHVEG